MAPKALKGGTILSDSLVELEFLDSSLLSLSSYRDWTSGSLSSSSRQRYLSQQYPPTPSKRS